MSQKFLLIAFSKDRPGIVADISQVIYENGFNLEDSSMTYLAGEFAILLLLSVPSNGVENTIMEKLSSECRRLEREKSITAYVTPVSGEQPKVQKDVIVKTIIVEGMDQSGIVYKISKFLADSGINIRTLSSEVRLSPQSGTELYCMTIVVEIPGSLAMGGVEDGLGVIGDQLNVDITLS